MTGRFANMTTEELVQARLARDLSAEDIEEIQQELVKRRSGGEPRPAGPRSRADSPAGRDPAPMRVRVVDVQVPFWSLVALMLKWTFAAIPAALVLLAIAAVVWVLAGGILTQLLGPR
ncbi:MAG TPA: hypothetical protein VJ596_11975 [Gemmatimonadaceae bacterium]|nr:hypothetical protein [Gemmatimonadaceae bacterium]